MKRARDHRTTATDRARVSALEKRALDDTEEPEPRPDSDSQHSSPDELVVKSLDDTAPLGKRRRTRRKAAAADAMHVSPAEVPSDGAPYTLFPPEAAEARQSPVSDPRDHAIAILQEEIEHLRDAVAEATERCRAAEMRASAVAADNADELRLLRHMAAEARVESESHGGFAHEAATEAERLRIRNGVLEKEAEALRASDAAARQRINELHAYAETLVVRIAALERINAEHEAAAGDDAWPRYDSAQSVRLTIGRPNPSSAAPEPRRNFWSRLKSLVMRSETT